MSVDKAVAVDSPAPPPTPVAEPSIGLTASPQPGGRVTRIEAVPAPAGGDPRPAWLPEKFKSPEDLSQAYAALEQRLGAIGRAPAPATPAVPPAPTAPAAPDAAAPAAPPPPAGAGTDLEVRIMQEFASTGQVSEATRQAFTQRTGLSPAYIDQQLGYLQHQDRQARDIAIQRLGGEAAVKELTEWARGKLSPEERAAFNGLIYSGDPAKAQIAVDGLAAKYEAEVGRAPRIIAGRRPQGDFGGVTPFQSDHELAAAVRDPKYKTDPAYRAQVEDRLSAAQRLGLIR